MVKLTITFNKSELPTEVEFFDKKHAALQFAKVATKDGYVKEISDDAGTRSVVYPYYMLSKMVIEEVSQEEVADVKVRDGHNPVQVLA